MIKLYQFHPAWDLPNGSPLCLKLETYLRMVEIPYENFWTNNVNEAPQGQMPYIDDNGTILGDSNFIIDYLKSAYDYDLDYHLNASELAMLMAMKRLIEDSLYWVVLYSRWREPRNWQKTKEEFFGSLSPVVKPIVASLARKQILKNLQGQGMGRHEAFEIYQIGIKDLTAINDFLADKPYLMGEQISSVDASAYGLLANILWTPIESPVSDQARTMKNLLAYCHRIRDRFYP